MERPLGQRFLENPWALLILHTALFVVLYLLWAWAEIAAIPRG